MDNREEESVLGNVLGKYPCTVIHQKHGYNRKERQNFKVYQS